MADLSSLGAHSCGVWTRVQAEQLLRPHQVRALLQAGVWQTLWPGVHCDAGFVPTAEQRAWAAVLASGGSSGPRSGGAVACGRTAARFWGLPLIDDDDPCTGAEQHRIDDVAVDRHLTVLRHGGRVLRRQRLLLRPGHVVRASSGLPVTSPLRTAVGCARLLSHEALVCLLDAALHLRLVAVAELDAAVAAARGRPGAVRLREAARAADGRSESPAETLARLLLLPVLPDLVPQFRLKEAGRVIARFDLGDGARKLAIEADGKRGHSGTDMVARDRRRDARAEDHGWWTERVTWFDLRRLPAQTQERLRRRAVHSTRGSRTSTRPPPARVPGWRSTGYPCCRSAGAARAAASATVNPEPTRSTGSRRPRCSATRAADASCGCGSTTDGARHYLPSEP